MADAIVESARNHATRLLQSSVERFAPLVEKRAVIGDKVGALAGRIGSLSPIRAREKQNDYIVEFNGVTKTYRTKKGTKTVLRDANFKVKRGRSLAILGQNGTGKSTLLRMLAGVEQPSEGSIRRGGRVSWPLGFGGGFASDISARQNCIFISRIYNADPQEVIDFVEDFAELGHYFDMPVKTYSSGMKARLAFGMSMAIEFDCYLIDELTAVGDKRFRDKCHAEFSARREMADVIMISHSVQTIISYCDTAAVLNNGRLEFYDDLHEAIEIYKAL